MGITDEENGALRGKSTCPQRFIKLGNRGAWSGIWSVCLQNPHFVIKPYFFPKVSTNEIFNWHHILKLRSQEWDDKSQGLNAYHVLKTSCQTTWAKILKRTKLLTNGDLSTKLRNRHIMCYKEGLGEIWLFIWKDVHNISRRNIYNS